ncbi:tripartite tricarboxylate transporter substrate-binding protein [Phreatobacter sp.]|uniref:Bug family tripartite tricarboxylate transporter substrate binding protein n=1 Tax=Phreatobacter sp. TaxID=1966341 RepID=UPI0022CCC1BC|nr:tripartite tricarboxylate transporter substrate-binding protein [Phreatobacter sp.]MCZ8314930.1 tripartite tricarboxylate transporter substrate-binding protein [Phreatobacter sp.]
MTISRRAALGALGSLAALPAGARRLSEQNITVIVPFTAGSGPDLLARVAGDFFRNRHGQTIVVENRPGASGNIGAGAAARAAPDGNTLVLYVNTFLMNAALSPSLPYDPVAGFAPIIELARGSLALAVHRSIEAVNVAALVAATRAQPQAIRYASPGRGTPHHLAMELFKLRSGAMMDHVPYNGTAGAVNDFVAGHVQAMFIPIHVGLAQASAGRIRLLAVASGERTPLAPSVPTLAEQGFRDAEVDLWYGLAAPAGTPAAILTRYNQAFDAMLADAEVRRQLETQGLSASGGPPQRLSALIAADLPRWRQVVERAGITADQ